MNYKQAFANTESHIDRTFFNSDMVGSKRLAQLPEWDLGRLYARAADYFDLCSDHLTRHGAERIRIEGDAVKAVFDPENAHAAINAGIAIHESSQALWGKDEYPAMGAIGITTGPGIDLGDDYHGMHSLLARHLALAASGLSIACCPTTIKVVNRDLIRSTAGKAVGRSGDEYVGNEMPLHVPISAESQPYYEILWADQKFGLKVKS